MVEASKVIVTVTEPIIKVKGVVGSELVVSSSEPVAGAIVPVSTVDELVTVSKPVAEIMGGATAIEAQLDVVAITFSVGQLETVSLGDPDLCDGGQNDAGIGGLYSSAKTQDIHIPNPALSLPPKAIAKADSSAVA